MRPTLIKIGAFEFTAEAEKVFTVGDAGGVEKGEIVLVGGKIAAAGRAESKARESRLNARKVELIKQVIGAEVGTLNAQLAGGKEGLVDGLM